MKYIALLAALALLTACGPSFRNTDQPLTAQADFDVTRYLGTWYEIARFPVGFQRSCTATTATYGPRDDTSITVVNQCRLGAPEGALSQISGFAELIGPGEMRVKFIRAPFIEGKYWVLWVDEGYQTAVVGTPNGRGGWILARSPEITADKRAKAEAVLQRNGYDTSALIQMPQATQ